MLSNQSTVDLTLQSLINTRFEVGRLRSSTRAQGRDFPGNRLARKRGQGIEFLDLRQYAVGDDVRHIDWNVTARTNEPYTRIYQQEKELITTVIVDLRPVMFNGSKCLRSVAAGHFAAATLWYAHNMGDRCAALVADSDGIHTTRPLPGHKGVLQSLELIAAGFRVTLASVSETTNDFSNTGLSNTLEHVLNNRNNTGRYFMFSGFDSDDEHYVSHLPAIGALGRLQAILLLDKTEKEVLPRGSYRYRFKGRNHHIQVNHANRKAIANYLEQQHLNRLSRLQDAGIDSMSMETDAPVSRFLTTLHQRSWV